MIVTFLQDDKPPLEVEFDYVPDLGEVIIVDGKTAWITAIGRQDVGVPKDRQWMGQYTFEREKYFK